MYRIDKIQNRINKVSERTFSELGFKEREHLQEWIVHDPGALGEELLIIQKEFDGFNDTNERLDILALDKQGNLVVIENKLDDSGKNVVWQVLKYAAYCSTLSKSEIREIYQQYLDKFAHGENAEENIVRFYNDTDFEELNLNKGSSQRIMLVARDFRKEVTSTVLWLLNYKLRLQCFKVTPFADDENNIFITFNQIIPLIDAEEFMISMAEKTQEDISLQEYSKQRYDVRIAFWKELLNALKQKGSSLFNNVSPSKDNWLQAGAGMSNVNYRFTITKEYARVDLSIVGSAKKDNKAIFDKLTKFKDEIESDFGESLIWERMDENISSRIKCELTNVNVFFKDDWNRMIEFMVDRMIRMEHTLKKPLDKIRK